MADAPNSSSETNFWKPNRHGGRHVTMRRGPARPSCFAIHENGQKNMDILREKHTQNMKALTPRPEEKQTLNTHSHPQGTGCKSKTCCMQTDPRKSEALRMRRKIVREFITRERGILIIFVYWKTEFFIVPERHVQVCLGTGGAKR